MSEGLLELDRLRVRYDDVLALRSLTLTLQPGEIYGLVGPNGSGKTTAFRAITGEIRPNGGTVRLDGRDPFLDPACRARIGFLTDTVIMHENLTPAEDLLHFAYAHRLDPPTAERRVDEALEQTDLIRMAPGDCSTLSRGMQQRLALSRLLVYRPHLLLLDEPAIGLDPVGRKLLWNVLHQFAREGSIVVISSHVLSDLQRLCTYAVILRKGEVVRSGTLAELTTAAEEAADSTGFRMRVRWRKQHVLMPDLLYENARVEDLETSDRTADFSFNGHAADLDELLADLLSRGVSIAEWRPHDDPLEDIAIAEYGEPRSVAAAEPTHAPPEAGP